MEVSIHNLPLSTPSHLAGSQQKPGQDMSSILALHSVLFGKCGLAISLVLASIATTFQPNGYALSLGGKPTVPVSHL